MLLLAASPTPLTATYAVLLLALFRTAAGDASEPALRKVDMPAVLQPFLVDSEVAKIRTDTTALHDLLDKNQDAHLSVDELIPLFERHEISKRSLEIDRLREKYSKESEQQLVFESLKTKGLVSPPPFTRGKLGIVGPSEEEHGSAPYKRHLVTNLKFAIYDENGDGLLQTDEFFDYLKIESRFTELHEEISQDVQKYSQLFFDLDANGDGVVDTDEINKGPQHPAGKENKVVLLEICDTNKNGNLDASEFYCYEDPQPVTLGAYHAKSIMAIEQHEPAQANDVGHKLSLDELSKALEFNKINKLVTAALANYHREL
jgi:Ca2+-binding EF-hand superfamily protein